MAARDGEFIWCDLSAYRPAAVRRFYASVFGWRFDDDYGGYKIAMAGGRPAAGLFEMPAKFRKMGMPSFWMSYLQVADTARAAERAEALGAKIEVAPTPFDDTGLIALIRDPLGAGFTVYDGTLGSGARRGRGGRLRHGLYVSDPESVREFYGELFGWRYLPAGPGWDRIESAGGTDQADLVAAPEALRGPYEFWGVHFGVRDLGAGEAAITAGGGTLTGRFELAGRTTSLAADPDGAAFFIDAEGRE